MSENRLETVGILTKPHSPAIQPILAELEKWLHDQGRNVIFDLSLSNAKQEASLTLKNQIAQYAQLIVVFGGDGTMLSAARLVAERAVPILGVNMGGLGFLTETTLSHFYEALQKVFTGEYQLDERLMLYAAIHRHQEKITEAIALNDVVINKGHLTRMISTKVWINDSFMTNMRGDGLIIATPTGSTGYSLSSNGPILDPSLDAFIVNPICPHTLSHRPFLVSSHATIKVMLTSQENARAAFDGQIGLELFSGDTVEITASEYRARLIRFPDRSYYDVLRNKLKWGDG